MAEADKPNEKPPNDRPSRAALRERQSLSRRVYLDPSSPSVRSIVRVVVVVLILLLIANWIQTLISDGYVCVRHPDLQAAMDIADAVGTDLTMYAG